MSVNQLISEIKVSDKKAVVGKSIRVDVRTIKPAVEVNVNGVAGTTNYLQFRAPGSHFIVVTASLGKQIEQKGIKINIRDLKTHERPLPLIWATQDRYRPRTLVFSVANASSDLSDVQHYEWDFGDGTQGISEDGHINHDYTDALDRDRFITAFHVRVDAQDADGAVTTAIRTIAVFNLYGYNKLRKRLLTPRVTVDSPKALNNEVVCIFTIKNLEDEEISFTNEKHEWLTAEIQDSSIIGDVAQSALEATVDAAIAKKRVTPRLAYLHVPPRSTVTVTRSFPELVFTGSVFGVAIHLKGTGMCSKLEAVSSAYIEVKLPMQWSGYVSDPTITNALSFFARSDLLSNNIVTHQDLTEFVRSKAVAKAISPAPVATELKKAPPMQDSAKSVFPPKKHSANSLGAMRYFEAQAILDTSQERFAKVLEGLLSPGLTPFDTSPIVPGAECDPDNLPDNLPEGMVCQLTDEFAWRYVPGRILNAKKGDILLDPGGPGLVGQLLRQVSPPQYYSHCGIMTKNHIELRHSTASDEWLRDNPAGFKGSDGFESAALKYLWPGTITQTIDDACFGQYLHSPPSTKYPGGNQYKIAKFSFAPYNSNINAIVYPVVIKPPPFDETWDVRLRLHAIAEAALAINGHYRLYCYTKPEIALGPEGIAGTEAGWAQGTVATVCSSFIWLAAQQANVRLEGQEAKTNVSDLEPKDIEGGAAVDTETLDGLYHYTEEERQAAGKWLYQTIYDEAHNAAGFWGRLFTDAPDNIANQICNTFTSDWADKGSKDSDNWKNPGTANAISPDNIIFWDSPGPGNQNQFRSVYGHMEDLFFLPGTHARVPIYRWKLVKTRGTLTGTVVANGDVTGANVSLLGSPLPDVVVQADGRFRFDNVPAGGYTVSAGLNIRGYWNSSKVPAHIDAGASTDVTITLQPPPEVNRLVTIAVDMETDWKSVFAHSPRSSYDTKSARVCPFHSHAHLDFDDGTNDDTPRGHIGFDIDLNADLSITVSWTAQEIDDEVEGEIKGGYTIAKDGSVKWSGLTVNNDDPIDADWTTMDFTIHNDITGSGC